ncbi:MAG: MBL fold metallo-hydrolase [Acidobacteriota bacterium]
MVERRDFVRLAGGCAAHLGWCGAFGRRLAAQSMGAASRLVVAEEPWGRIERIADGVWALISTPLTGGPTARTTLSNGGIVAGTSGVAIVEGFASPDGARWMARQARRLTGRALTHVVVTHFHGDHTAGLPAYRDDGGDPQFVTTSDTRGRLTAPDVVEALRAAQLVDGSSPATVDLGGRRLTITPRSGHTTSDLSVVVDDPAVMFGGDLLWNRFFPNYVDAIPSLLSQAVRSLSADGNIVRVPGHGPIFEANDLTHYIGVLDVIEEAARKARAAGTPADEAATSIALPGALGQWALFNPNYFAVALRAWEREAR